MISRSRACRFLSLVADNCGRLRRPPSSPVHLQYAYVDATPHRIAALLWLPDDISLLSPSPQHRNPFISLQKQHPGPTSDCTRVYAVDATEAINNNVAELLSIHLAVENAAPRSVLCCCVDSTTAKGWVRRGLAASPFVNRVIRSLHRHLLRLQIRLMIAWVPSPDNLSDAFSRDDRRTGEIRGIHFRPPGEDFVLVSWF